MGAGVAAAAVFDSSAALDLCAAQGAWIRDGSGREPRNSAPALLGFHAYRLHPWLR